MNKAEFQAIVSDFPLFAKEFLHIRSKSGQIKKFELNRAQLYAHSKLQQQLKDKGKVRALILKGRQQGMCYFSTMRVMTEDYQWKTIADIKVGDRIMAIDEKPKGHTKSGRNSERRIRVTEIEAKAYLKEEVFEVILSNGAKLLVTGKHRHLCQLEGKKEIQWVAIDDCKIGDSIRAFSCVPDNHVPDFEDGWFGGLLDGEGSFGAYPNVRISISQVDGEVLRRAKKYLTDRGIKYYELIDRRTSGVSSKLGDKEVHCIRIDRCSDILRILTLTRPTRFVNRPLFVNKKLPKSCTGFDAWVKILSIKPMGEMEVVDLQTEHKTFICEGIVSHNSTMIQARYFHRVITRRGTKAYILTHEAEATKNLFEMTQRYYDKLPPGLCTPADKASTKELSFKKYDSGYAVGTAGNKGAGRSQTIQLFHGSEVGFWPHAEDHAKGVLQAVSNEPGTEIILESTANGIGNYFHSMWKAAESKHSEFIPIFIPWYWQEEYVASDVGFSMSEEESYIYSLYKDDGMTIGHLAWRRIKISEFSNDPDVGMESFKQEFPCTATEAFLNPIANVFINAKHVVKARRAKIESDTRLIIGVDVAMGDTDKTAIIRRKGRVAYQLETFRNMNTMEIAGYLKRVIESEHPHRVYIDCIGIGAGVVDRLREQNYIICEGINVARSANQKDKFRNLRAELWSEMRDWLTQEMPVQIPDDDTLHGDLCNLGYKYDSSGRLLIESKDDLRARGMPSPDTSDALALTFFSGFYDLESDIEITTIPKLRPGMFV